MDDSSIALGDSASGLAYSNHLTSGASMLYIYDSNGDLVTGQAIDFSSVHASNANFNPATDSLQDVHGQTIHNCPMFQFRRHNRRYTRIGQAMRFTDTIIFSGEDFRICFTYTLTYCINSGSRFFYFFKFATQVFYSSLLWLIQTYTALRLFGICFPDFTGLLPPDCPFCVKAWRKKIPERSEDDFLSADSTRRAALTTRIRR